MIRESISALFTNSILVLFFLIFSLIILHLNLVSKSIISFSHVLQVDYLLHSVAVAIAVLLILFTFTRGTGTPYRLGATSHAPFVAKDYNFIRLGTSIENKDHYGRRFKNNDLKKIFLLLSRQFQLYHVSSGYSSKIITHVIEHVSTLIV